MLSEQDIRRLKFEICSGNPARIKESLVFARNYGPLLDEFYLDLIKCTEFYENWYKELFTISKFFAKVQENGLTLSNLELKYVPNCFSCLSFCLEKIDISQNKLTEFPLWLLECKDLKSIDVHDNQIIHFPEELFQLSKLEEIRVQNNLDFRIHQKIRHLQSVKKIHVTVFNENEKWDMRHFKFLSEIQLEIKTKKYVLDDFQFPAQLKFLGIKGNPSYLIIHDFNAFQSLMHIELKQLEVEISSKFPALKSIIQVKLDQIKNSVPLENWVYSCPHIEELILGKETESFLRPTLRNLEMLKHIYIEFQVNPEEKLLWEKRIYSWFPRIQLFWEN